MIILERGSAGFDAAWRRLPATAGEPAAVPQAIALPVDAGEVAAAIDHARGRGLPVTVRGGGHSLCGSHLRAGALVLDLREMYSVSVDLAGGVARVGGGATSLDAARQLDAAGASFPVGHSPAVGLGGFLLSGGNGWGGTWWGVAGHRVRAATVVTGDGRIRRVDEAADPELMWAVRGAGAAFPGVVTEFSVDVEPVRVTVERAVLTVDGSAAGRLGSLLDAAGERDGIEPTVLARPDTDGGSCTVVATGFAPPAESAGAAGDLLRSFRLGEVTARRFSGIGAMLAEIDDFADEIQRSDHRWAAPSWQQVLDGLPMTLPALSPHSSLLVARAPRPLLAEAPYMPPPALGVSAYAHLPSTAAPSAVEDARSWIRQALSPLGEDAGRYIGEADLLPDAGGLRGCLPTGAVGRLRRLRQLVDPDHVVDCALD